MTATVRSRTQKRHKKNWKTFLSGRNDIAFMTSLGLFPGNILVVEDNITDGSHIAVWNQPYVTTIKCNRARGWPELKIHFYHWHNNRRTCTVSALQEKRKIFKGTRLFFNEKIPVLRIRIKKMRMRIQEKILMRIRIHVLAELWRAK